MRSGPLVALLVGAVLVVLYLAPAVRAQGTPVVSSIANFQVTAVDTNGNGKYDALVSTFNATVTVAGNFRFSAQVAAGFGYMIVTNNTDVNLDVGTHALRASVPGPYIHQSGQNGPYDFRLTVSPVDDTGMLTYSGIGPAETFTPAYNATDFDGPWAYFGSPIADQGIDTDGNGLYDSLVVHVPIAVNQTTYVQVSGYLTSPYGYLYQSNPTEALLTTAGAHTVDLTWSGIALHQAGSLFTGPLTANLYLDFPDLLAGSYTYYYPYLSRTSYVLTHSYTASQFERASAYFSAASATTTAQDTNGNGLADFLVFHLPVTVRVAGDYGVSVQLPSSSYGGVPGGARIVHLSAGNQTVDVSVSGIALSRLTTLTPNVGASISRIGASTYYDSDSITWALPNFSPTSFESRPVSILSVSAAGGNATCAQAYAWDPTNRYLSTAYSYYGFSGTLQMPLYDGTFYLVAQFCTSGPGSVAAKKVTVSGATSVTMNATTPAPLTESMAIGVPSWNTTQMTTTASLGGQGALYRLIADFYGNADGTAESNELANLALILSSGYLYFGGGYGLAREDNVSLPFARSYSATFTGAGEITSTSPLTYTLQLLAYTGNTPKAGDHHRLVLDIAYATQGMTETVTVSVGASAGGNLSLVSRQVMYDGDGFTWPANATATKTGATSWSITVGQRPQNEPSVVQLEIVVDAYGTPPPATSSLLDYIANPLAVTLIVVVVAVAAFALLARKKKGPAPPTPPAT